MEKPSVTGSVAPAWEINTSALAGSAMKAVVNPVSISDRHFARLLDFADTNTNLNGDTILITTSSIDSLAP